MTWIVEGFRNGEVVSWIRLPEKVAKAHLAALDKTPGLTATYTGRPDRPAQTEMEL